MLMVRAAALAAAALAPALAQHYPPESSLISALVRDFFPGGMFFNDWHKALNAPYNSTYNPRAFRSPVTTFPNRTKKQSFLGPPMSLAPGEIINNYIPINWPEGDIRITSFSADIVKLKKGADPTEILPTGFPDIERAVREEVYLHHWTVNKWQMGKAQYDKFAKSEGINFDSPPLADAGMNSGANGPCGLALLHFLFGAGNEVRGPTPSGHNATYFFPDPYGLESNSVAMHEEGILMLFNAHLIDIRGVADRRGCAECDCNVTKTRGPSPNYTGGLECCHSTHHDGARCGLLDSTDPSANQTYYVEYELVWRDASDDVYVETPFKPLNAMILDISDDGKTWYDPFPLVGTHFDNHVSLKKDPVSMASLASAHSGMPNDGHFTWVPLAETTHGCHAEYWVPPCRDGDACVHRFHNSWVMPFDMEIVAVHNHMHIASVNMTTSAGGAPLCTGLSRYGVGGFLVEVTNCHWGRGFREPVRVARGQRIDVESVYEQDRRPHFGVMGYAMIYGHRLDVGGGRGPLLV